MININDFIYSLLIYLVIFIIPTILYIKLKEKQNILKYLKIVGNAKRGFYMAFFVCSIFIILLITKNAITSFNKLNLNIGMLWISALFVGVLEEIPFRGFLLQKLSNYMQFWKANLLTTMIFVVIHFPIWINSNTPILKTSISISMVSLSFGYLFKKYNTLWIPIICHSIYNVCIWIGL